MKNRIGFMMLLLAICACSSDAMKETSEPIPDPIVSNLDGPISKPTSGYGTDGTYSVSKITFENPLYNKSVEVFHSTELTTAQPVLFYSHPFGGNNSSNLDGLFNFLTSKGYIVVYVPYPTIGASIDDRYDILWAGFEKAVNDYPNLIDTTKVGFIGYSFGGGASFGLGHKGFVENGWGEDGRFIYSMAPWYAYQLTNEQLTSFPDNTKLIVQVFEDDATNDHRMGIDLFKGINISNTEKDFIMIQSDEISGYNYTTAHNLPNTVTALDAYDYYGIYRLLDALIDYSFNGNASAKDVALGNGSDAQVIMPSLNGETLKSLLVTDTPTSINSQSFYTFPCNNAQNPRIGECE